VRHLQEPLLGLGPPKSNSGRHFQTGLRNLLKRANVGLGSFSTGMRRAACVAMSAVVPKAAVNLLSVMMLAGAHRHPHRVSSLDLALDRPPSDGFFYWYLRKHLSERSLSVIPLADLAHGVPVLGPIGVGVSGLGAVWQQVLACSGRKHERHVSKSAPACVNFT
jgi:hypothetical protein